MQTALRHDVIPSAAPLALPVPDARLDWLRAIAARCRCTARTDLFRACAVLSEDRSAAAKAYAEALIRAMPSGRMTFYQPGSRDLSFDERWLLALMDAAERGDEASLTFLMARRLPRHTRRSVGVLVTNVVRQLDRAA
ncbi:MAG: hypothetical protein AAF376_19245 [Pseudomonadota bacterium]